VGLRTVLEGESLLNDGFALVAFGLAVSAAAGPAEPVHIALRLAEVIPGSVAVGVAVAWSVEHLRRRLREPSTEIVVSLITPYASYLIADRIHTSGVLAVVATGLWLGWRSPGLFLPRTRLQAATFWNLLAMLMNSTLFLLIGLEFRHVLERIGGASPSGLVVDSLAVLAATALIRLAAVSVVGPAVRLPLARLRDQESRYGWRESLVIGWSGFRGAVSVAAALSVPLAAGGKAVPDRPMIVYLTFVVVLGTLVVQGGLLPTGLRLLGFREQAAPDRGAVEARAAAVQAAIDRIEEMSSRDDAPQDVLDSLRQVYDRRLEHLSSMLHGGEDDHDEDLLDQTRHRRELRGELIAVQRDTVRRMRDQGAISSEEMRRIVRELDLEDVSLQEGPLRAI
jgi:monovalent cation/hydrogen antiporter